MKASAEYDALPTYEDEQGQKASSADVESASTNVCEGAVEEESFDKKKEEEERACMAGIIVALATIASIVLFISGAEVIWIYFVIAFGSFLIKILGLFARTAEPMIEVLFILLSGFVVTLPVRAAKLPDWFFLVVLSLWTIFFAIFFVMLLCGYRLRQQGRLLCSFF